MIYDQIYIFSLVSTLDLIENVMDLDQFRFIRLYFEDEKLPNDPFGGGSSLNFRTTKLSTED